MVSSAYSRRRRRPVARRSRRSVRRTTRYSRAIRLRRVRRFRRLGRISNRRVVRGRAIVPRVTSARLRPYGGTSPGRYFIPRIQGRDKVVLRLNATYTVAIAAAATHEYITIRCTDTLDPLIAGGGGNRPWLADLYAATYNYYRVKYVAFELTWVPAALMFQPDTTAAGSAAAVLWQNQSITMATCLMDNNTALPTLDSLLGLRDDARWQKRDILMNSNKPTRWYEKGVPYQVLSPRARAATADKGWTAVAASPVPSVYFRCIMTRFGAAGGAAGPVEGQIQVNMTQYVEYCDNDMLYAEQPNVP